VWGKDMYKVIAKASNEMIRRVKRIVPTVIVAGFIIAAWLIYII
jgi:peptidoglycan/LPS O-acetylase OafA/YrhL